MSKRVADRQITQDSVGRDEEPEDPGRFERASHSELESRVFKKARRTRPTACSAGASSDQGAESGGLFSGIQLTGLLDQHNGLSESQQVSPHKTPEAGNSSESQPNFLSELQSLNTSVNNWIGKHVRENPYVDLTPIFRDYEKHLRELDLKFSSTDPDRGEEVAAVVDSTQSCSGALATENKEEEEEEEEDMKMMSSDGKEREEVTMTEGKGEEKEALLSVRAKLFFKRSSDSEFCELGLGQLQVLPGSGTEVKVVMRNDTTLAKVLLNVRVRAGLPLSCKKNNVLLVCPPNPPLEKVKSPEEESAPVTYLIRVKTVALATELLKTLQLLN